MNMFYGKLESFYKVLHLMPKIKILFLHNPFICGQIQIRHLSPTYEDRHLCNIQNQDG